MTRKFSSSTDEHSALEQEIVKVRLQLGQAQMETALRDQRIYKLRHSLSWHITLPVRKIRPAVLKQRDLIQTGQQKIVNWGSRVSRRVASMLKEGSSATSQQADEAPLPPSGARRAYADWIARFDILHDADMDIFRQINTTYHRQLAPVRILYQFDSHTLRNAAEIVESLQAQYFTNWQAIFLFDPSCDAQQVAAVNAHITDARITAASPFPALQEDEALVLASGHVCLRPHALLALSCAARSGARLVYGDEDMRSRRGIRHTPFFKPDFSPELLYHVDYLTGGSMLAGDAALNRHVLSALLAGQDMQAVLQQAVEGLSRAQTCHVPFILSHLLGAEPDRQHGTPPRLSCPTGGWPTVSIIIPTRDRLELLRACLDSVMTRTDYPSDRIEIIIVDNGSVERATLDYLSAGQGDKRFTVIRDDGPYNYSRLNNLAAAQAHNDIIVLLNNDTEVLTPAWLKLLTSQAIKKDVAAVGGKLLYGNRTVQHAGCVIGKGGGGTDHVGIGLKANDGGYFGLMNATREVSAVTAACLAIRKSVFEELGGLDIHLAVAFNDTLLCLAAQEKGYRNITIGTPLMLHYESRSRGYDDTPDKQALCREELKRTRDRYLDVFENDPYYNPNLDIFHLYGLAWPPRRGKFWRRIPGISHTGNILILLPAYPHDEKIHPFAELQAQALLDAGYNVTIGGSRAGMGTDMCPYVQVKTIKDAATLAVAQDIDCIVASVDKFYSITDMLGNACRTVFYDADMDNMQDCAFRYFSPRGHSFGRLYMTNASDDAKDVLKSFVDIVTQNMPTTCPI